MDFYDTLAAEYDHIVDQDSRLDAARQFVRRLAERGDLASAVDAACGTGLYARALAEQGVAVIAADISESMLRQAQLAGEDDRIRWIRAAMQSLADHVPQPADAVLCMGNSLPHLLTDDDLAATLAGFRSILKTGGAAVIQLLNYQRLLARQERIVGVTRSGDRQYVRFYDFRPDFIQFNLLQLHWDGNACRHQLHQTPLRPYAAATLEPALIRAGFASVRRFGGLDFSAFDPTESNQLLLVAQ